MTSPVGRAAVQRLRDQSALYRRLRDLYVEAMQERNSLIVEVVEKDLADTHTVAVACGVDESYIEELLKRYGGGGKH